MGRYALRDQWERALATLPADWSDLYAEVQLDSTDYVERAALMLAPVNPARYAGATGLRFRCARTFGYGVSPEMAGRCLQRCDDERMTGTEPLCHHRKRIGQLNGFEIGIDGSIRKQFQLQRLDTSF